MMDIINKTGCFLKKCVTQGGRGIMSIPGIFNRYLPIIRRHDALRDIIYPALLIDNWRVKRDLQ